MCKLTDFTLDELDVMQIALAEKQADYIDMKIRTELIWGDGHENAKFWAERSALASTCLVQIMTARQIVKDRETANAN